MIYWTSDTHFGHRNIIKYCNRPFATPAEMSSGNIPDEAVHRMDEALIRNWNSLVGPEDTIYHLGDFSMRDVEHGQKILDRLNGIKHLCPGNHDKVAKKLQGWTSIEYYRELRFEEQFIVMLHYGMRVWNKSHHGAIQLYGHSHGSLPGDSQQLDVGTDCWDYHPVTLDQIMRRLRTLPVRHPVDHHGRE